ncbi:hypothetical protein UABAM_02839 [Candidatus Uabimicrobium amorphum]|uniref:Uncharacterized protein n=1 Tax=Uabimicrobium amorphum TaxID=2596890 RepID=A0A5S9IM82_UABAM|nr:hypothetical protein UABAM_02839 [Candidatus Uabimicrobium amorphum]
MTSKILMLFVGIVSALIANKVTDKLYLEVCLISVCLVAIVFL